MSAAHPNAPAEVPPQLPPPTPREAAMVAAFWQAVLPGLGHVYARHALRGMGWLVVCGLGIVAAIAPLLYVRPGWWGLTLAAVLAVGPLLLATVDAAWIAHRGDEAARRQYGGARRITRAGGLIVLAMLAFLALAGLLVFTLWLPLASITNDAMGDTLMQGDRVLTDRWATAVKRVVRGDVVMVNLPGDVEPALVPRRVVGLPGETVEIRRGAMWVDGKPLSEPYVRLFGPGVAAAGLDLPPAPVPPGHVFVLADNRAQARDSRDLGPLPLASLRGRPVLVVWSKVPPASTTDRPHEVRWDRVFQVIE